MKLLFGQKVLVTLGLFVLLSFSSSYWLSRTLMGMNPVSPPLFDDNLYPKMNASGYINGLTNPGEDFFIRQHGEYWVLYNYIKAVKKFTGNDSVTLVLHSDWTDIVNLQETFKRWNGPISLTVFTCGVDLDRALRALAHLQLCPTLVRGQLYDYVSINVILHQDFLPEFIPWQELNTFLYSKWCQETLDLTENDRLKHNLSFPSSLARNVGRLTARTHFVLLLDVDFIPSVGIPELFLKMIKAKGNTDHPQKTVYVLPSFDIKHYDTVPKRDIDFRLVDQEFMQLYLNSSSLYKIRALREWLETNKSDTDIFYRTKNWGQWLGYYISANDIEPFYDETYSGESAKARSDHLHLLNALDYDFYVVNFGFVVHRRLPPYTFNTEITPNNDMEKLKNISILKNFFKNFV